ncbi:hypothetical protein [Parvularcula sp. LCG005]|uniref:hypothetical protein n=1 Tax=Parvularcula sp. LCG005 TaxID=3078805 RepID=UPI002943EB36|nr:hypothetical protein [Parvularcula sp. LCG005]WOI54309.1 hypothetical protein RUI03_04735 [Parvularcula sp. LCG005]
MARNIYRELFDNDLGREVLADLLLRNVLLIPRYQHGTRSDDEVYKAGQRDTVVEICAKAGLTVPNISRALMGVSTPGPEEDQNDE